MKKIINEKVKLFFESIGLHVRRSNFSKNYLSKHEVIFIHVPKVAGTAFKRELKIPGGHIHLFTYELENKKKFDKYFKIGFVRNPWDRLVSAFFYMKQGGDASTHGLMISDRLKKFDTFENFVFELDKNIEFRKEILKVIVFSNQYCWLMNSIGEIEMDYIGRFENLQDGFEVLKEKLHKCDAQLKKHNESNHKPYWLYYNEDTVEIVRKIYSRDIITFNYDFPYDKLKQ